MKKTLLFASLLFIGLSSCKKDRTCHCEFKHNSPTGSTSYSTGYTITSYKKTKKEAINSDCSSYQKQYSDGSTDYQDCNLN